MPRSKHPGSFPAQLPRIASRILETHEPIMLKFDLEQDAARFRLQWYGFLSALEHRDPTQAAFYRAIMCQKRGAVLTFMHRDCDPALAVVNQALGFSPTEPLEATFQLPTPEPEFDPYASFMPGQSLRHPDTEAFENAIEAWLGDAPDPDHDQN